MKKITLFLFFTTLIFNSITFSSCCNEQTDKPKEKIVNTPTEKQTNMSIINNYLISEIGSQYTQGDVCIPCSFIIAENEYDTNDILVWGIFWVYHYNIVGDTLKTISGGTHSGIIHICKNYEINKVTQFEQVLDGSAHTESAKRIFGDKYAIYQKIYSDDKEHKKIRERSLADFVRKNNLNVSKYQDFGWDALPIEKK